MATDPESFMDATEDFLGKIEKSKLVSKKELEAVRQELVDDQKADAKRTVEGMQTATVGGAKVLVRNSDNLRKLNLSTERRREKLSSFRLSYLDRNQVQRLTSDGTLNDDPKKFIRHSRRLARHAREFLTQIGEAEPQLQEEVDAALAQIEDNDMDLLKLEVKSLTRLTETMLRGLNSQKERGQVLKEIEDWDMNRQLFNLSLLEHPDAVVRTLFANASERMASAATTDVSEIPKLAHVFVGLPPAAAKSMTPASRTAEFAWRLFDQKSLQEKYDKLPAKQASPSSWRDLGLNFNTKEWYIPVPPAIVEGLRPIAAAKRAAQLELAREFAAASAITRPL